ncbi:YceI family protein [Algibacillus agarilyticus]|uniref:YceI family protein n=1 Tax=Algibacillus agarilyticus TaxID=2234133 RepID=UPI000DD02FC8|nr:YceI family protein [Algibacillus agarilyticus]
MNKTFIAALLSASALFTTATQAADYIIDTKGTHASINFKIKHLGYSWLTGRFNRFSGNFSYDAAKPNESSITVSIDPASIDSNHAERDKHLRNSDFLAVSDFPTSSFISKSITAINDRELLIKGDFTLHGVTNVIEFTAEKIGEGKDPWKGYRVGFTGTTSIALADYNITHNLGPASTHVELELNIEGIRQ